jgi:predicted thioesterase
VINGYKNTYAKTASPLNKELDAMELVPGLEGEMELEVSTRHLSSATGNFGVDVISTHEVVLLMELAARKAVQGRLPDGMITVGTRVEIHHMAAALLGAKVLAHALLVEVLGRKLLFDVEARDGFGVIALGKNEQLIVSRPAFLKRVHRRTGMNFTPRQ